MGQMWVEKGRVKKKKKKKLKKKNTNTNTKKRAARGEGDKQAIHKGIAAALYGISRSWRGITWNTARRLHVNHHTDLELSCCLNIALCPLPTTGLLRWTPGRDALGGHPRGQFCFFPLSCSGQSLSGVEPCHDFYYFQLIRKLRKK